MKPHPTNYSINLIEGKSLSKPAKAYLISISEQTSLNVWMKEELQKEYILQSDSETAALFFFIKKADSRLRPYMDY